jgi:hypothetical protein
LGQSYEHSNLTHSQVPQCNSLSEQGFNISYLEYEATQLSVAFRQLILLPVLQFFKVNRFAL